MGIAPYKFNKGNNSQEDGKGFPIVLLHKSNCEQKLAKIKNIAKPLTYSAKQYVKELLRSGKSLFSKSGAFAPLSDEKLNSI